MTENNFILKKSLCLKKAAVQLKKLDPLNNGPISALSFNSTHGL